ncbi:helix-turn-helix transcriptional regulator [Myxococcota bacterium]|nr:helix-turn-helix transcriptional regulator [Myxococcota bacterium]
MGANTKRELLYELLGGDDPTFELKVEAGTELDGFLIQIQEHLESNKISQAEIARRLGVSKRQVNRWLTAHTGLRAESLIALTKAAGMELRLFESK